MNIKQLHILAFWTVLSACCFSACSEEEWAGGTPGGESAGLRFAVAPMGAATKVSYEGVTSQFDEGETIGCIIATKDLTADNNTPYAYAANSRWTYTGGYLVLEEVFTQNWLWGTGWQENTVSNLISETTPNADDGFLTIEDQTRTFAFYFYYPYIDASTLTADYNEVGAAAQDGSTTPFYQLLQYPNCATASTQSSSSDNYYLMSAAGNENSTYSGSMNYMYLWTAYPCFANHTQSTKTQTNHSDFLWVKCESITHTSNQRVNLVFEKKTATIEVESDTQLSSIYFQPQGAQQLCRGRQINLQTGGFSAYESITWGTIQQQNVYFTESEQLLPYDNSNGAKTNFRLSLPYQEEFLCNLCFTLNNGTEDKAYTIDLSNNIPSLQEGYLYIIHISQSGETTFDIVDWEDGNLEILDPDTDLESETTEP